MERDQIHAVIEELLKALTVQFRAVERYEGSAHPTYHIATDDAPLLIGAGGENLKALNYLAKRIVERKLGGEATRFLLDVNGYQRRRIETIERQARLLAERARSFKTDVEMNPLNAYERMIVHNLFADDPDVTTESVGVGKGRRVVFRCHSTFAGADTNDSLLIE